MSILAISITVIGLWLYSVNFLIDIVDRKIDARNDAGRLTGTDFVSKTVLIARYPVRALVILVFSPIITVVIMAYLVIRLLIEFACIIGSSVVDVFHERKRKISHG